jgi:HEAT repeat protein
LACIIVKEKGFPTLNLQLAEGKVSMGRSKNNSVVLHNRYVSGKHCEIACENDVYTLVDLKSTNGLFVNGQRVTSKALEDGDKILAGTSLILYIADEHAFNSDEYVAQLREGSRDERELAANLLGQFGSADAVGPLIEAVKHDTEPVVKAAAAEALSLVGDSRAVGVLLPLFGTEDTAVRNSVVRALVRIADTKAVDGLIPYLRHTDQKVRVLAAYTLGRLHDARATEELIKALDDNAFVVREAAVKALGDIADPRAVDALMEAAGEPGRFPQVWVIESLGKMRRPEPMKIILKAMSSHDSEVREAAADALGKLRTAEAVPTLLQALDDPEPKVRTSTATALEKLRVHLEMTKSFTDSRETGRKTIEIAAIGEHEEELSHGKPKFGEDRSKWEKWWSKQSRK